MVESTTHLAAPPMTIGGKFHRQVCMWCGHIIDDTDLEAIAVCGDEKTVKLSWEGLVRVTDMGGFRELVVAKPLDGGRLPDDFCGFQDGSALRDGRKIEGP